MYTGGILDPIVTVERVICLVVADTFGIGGLGHFAGPEFGGHFIANFDISIGHVLLSELPYLVTLISFSPVFSDLLALLMFSSRKFCNNTRNSLASVRIFTVSQ